MPADGGVVAAHAASKIDHAYRTQPLNQDQERKQRALEREPCHLQHRSVALRAIHCAGYVDQGSMQRWQRGRDMGLRSPLTWLDAVFPSV